MKTTIRTVFRVAKSYKIFIILMYSILGSFNVFGQLSDDCKLSIGTNITGLVNFGNEIPFVDMMRSVGAWRSTNIDGPGIFDEGYISQLKNMSFRQDGYPTHIPQTIEGSEYDQRVFVAWEVTTGWPVGKYTVLWEGEGSLKFTGTYTNLETSEWNRLTFDVLNPKDGFIGLEIISSDINNPLHNIRVLMPGTETTYQDQPFYEVWLERLKPFKTIRFMDWGQTNNWGKVEGEDWDNPKRHNWSERSKVDYFTWSYEKGVPYEMMVRLMNELDIDGWVCVPHTASQDYITNMARFFKDNLESDRHLYVEYSNEIWNWMFDQTHWANKYGGNPDLAWPASVAPLVEDCLRIWTEEYEGQLHRITRVVGSQVSWSYIGDQITNNVESRYYDAISPTYYFNFSEEDESLLDEMGETATVNDIAAFARNAMPTRLQEIQEEKDVADAKGKKLVFYEGGQHITPYPFGALPTYAKALLDIHKHDVMYDLYNEWFDMLRTLQEGDDPLLLMNFAFIGAGSAQYGSWGILETMHQDLLLDPAPKYKAIIENIENNSCENGGLSSTEFSILDKGVVQLYPNPTQDVININGIEDHKSYQFVLKDVKGITIKTIKIMDQKKVSMSLDEIVSGIYFLEVKELQTDNSSKFKIVKY